MVVRQTEIGQSSRVSRVVRGGGQDGPRGKFTRREREAAQKLEASPVGSVAARARHCHDALTARGRWDEMVRASPQCLHLPAATAPPSGGHGCCIRLNVFVVDRRVPTSTTKRRSANSPCDDGCGLSRILLTHSYQQPSPILPSEPWIPPRRKSLPSCSSSRDLELSLSRQPDLPRRHHALYTHQDGARVASPNK